MTDELVQTKAIEVVQMGTIQAMNYDDVIFKATGMAKSLAKIIEGQGLSKVISGRRYVYVEGWSTLGAMMGILPREVEVIEHDNGDFEATVELIRASDGEVIGRASSIVGYDENTWQSRPRYARRSMCVTRATGKAFRLMLSWIVKLAGYEPTPAEEMDGVVEASFREVGQRRQQQKPQRKPATPTPDRITADDITQDAIEDAGPETLMTIEEACQVTNSDGEYYGQLSDEKLSLMTIGINKGLKKPDLTDEKREEYLMKLDAIKTILQARESGEI